MKHGSAEWFYGEPHDVLKEPFDRKVYQKDYMRAYLRKRREADKRKKEEKL